MDQELQQTLIFVAMVVLGLGVAIAVILGCIALYRGRFRLNSDPAEEKVVFVLMNKKIAARPDAKNMPPIGAGTDRAALPASMPEVKKG